MTRYFVLRVEDDGEENVVSQVTFLTDSDSWGRVVSRKWREIETYPYGYEIPSHQGYEEDPMYTDPSYDVWEQDAARAAQEEWEWEQYNNEVQFGYDPTGD